MLDPDFIIAFVLGKPSRFIVSDVLSENKKKYYSNLKDWLLNITGTLLMMRYRKKFSQGFIRHQFIPL